VIDLLEKLKALLWEEWDPIGVRGLDPKCPNDEYDSYALEVLKMLEAGATATEIEVHLAELETGHIGLPNHSGRAGSVAEKAVVLRRESKR
jgi:hypothetical protein